MLDINLIREKPEVVRKALKTARWTPAPVDSFCSWMKSAAPCSDRWKQLKAERNTVSKGDRANERRSRTRQSKIEAMRVVGDKIAELDKQVAQVESELNYAYIHTAEYSR
jgi:seryl-tRNA synthetase